LSAGGQDDDRGGTRATVGTEAFEDREPVLAWQHEVEDNEVGLVGGDVGENFEAIGEANALMPISSQVKGYKFGDIRFIIDDQYFTHSGKALDNVSRG
jgi:hypothetical protein